MDIWVWRKLRKKNKTHSDAAKVPIMRRRMLVVRGVRPEARARRVSVDGDVSAGS